MAPPRIRFVFLALVATVALTHLYTQSSLFAASESGPTRVTSPLRQAVTAEPASGSDGSGDETDSPASSSEQGVAGDDSHGTAGHTGLRSGCPQKFLYFGNTFGRHSNQMSSLTTAFALAKQLGRTLVVPYLSEKKLLRPTDFYDFSGLEDKFCFVHEEAFVREHKDSAKRSSIDAACVTMRGIKTIPRHPQGLRIQCSVEEFVKYKKDVGLVVGAARKLSAHKLITIPLVIYISEAIPEVHCVWGGLKPSPPMERLLSAFMATDDGKKIKGQRYTAVHLRSLEGSCVDRVMKFGSKDKKQDAIAQCNINAAYVKKYSGGRDEPFFLADDGQRTDARAALVAAGGVRSGAFRTPSSLHGMLLDFWLLARSEVFVGNQMSTLSTNVCRWRTAKGKKCDNWLVDPGIDMHALCDLSA